MTGNVVLLAIYLASGHWQQALRHVPPYRHLSDRCRCSKGVGFVSYAATFRCVAGEIVLFLGLSFLPDGSSNFLIVNRKCFRVAANSHTFRPSGRLILQPTFTTGNLRTLSESFFDWAFRGRSLASFKQTSTSPQSASLLRRRGRGRRADAQMQNRNPLLVAALLSAALVWLVFPAKQPTRPIPHLFQLNFALTFNGPIDVEKLITLPR